MMKIRRNSVRTLPMCFALLASTALAVSACDSKPEHHEQPKTSTPQAAVRTPAPYPPLKIDWDVDESLTEEAKGFAQFAVETQADGYRFLDANTFDSDSLDRYNERVVADHKKTKYDWQAWHVGIPATGGELIRAISATPVEAGQRIDFCEFNTPGVFDVADGKIKLESKRVLLAGSMTVKSTTQPSGTDSHTAKTPRLLVVSIGSPDVENKDADSLCDKFAPEPFTQATPSPTPSASQSK
ncbi:hypothetical protein ACFYXQ_03715 [Nocardia jiangxiensis]|uniref:Lipoprotein n=1 Tax=Nocardia jiangxiensis TaxID=282685 RepID=A0ABW6RUC6_9NOCA